MDFMQQLESFQLAKKNACASNPARRRLAMLFDDGIFTEQNGLASSTDVICGLGHIAGQPVCAFSQGGPLGEIQTQKILKLYDLAKKIGCPVVGIYDSTGLYVGEGAAGMNACSELIAASSSLSGIVPQISLIAGVCIGMNAMLACAADYVIIGDCAEFFITPPTAQTLKTAGEQASLVATGSAHLFVTGEENLLLTASKLLSLLPSNNLGVLPLLEYESLEDTGSLFLSAYQNLEQVSASTLAEILLDTNSLLELYPTFGVHVWGGFGTLEGVPCGLIVTQGTSLTSDDCDKIARLVCVWDNFGIPIVTLVNTTGMDANSQNSFDEGMRSLSKLGYVYSQSTVPKISLITGNAWGASFTALAGKAANVDYTLAWPRAVISVLPPVTAVAFQIADRIQVGRTREQLEEEYCTKEASALNAAQQGIIDEVIDPVQTRSEIVTRLSILSSKRAGHPNKKHGNILL